MLPNSVGRSKSLLEEMLDSLQRDEDKPNDLPPPLPERPKLGPKARLPSLKRPLSFNFEKLNKDFSSDLGNSKIEVVNTDSSVFSRNQSFEDKKSREIEPSESPYEEMEIEFEPRFMESKRDGYIDYFINKKLCVWCNIKDNHWEKGIIRSAEGKKASIQLEDGNVVLIQLGNLLPANPVILEGVDDLIQLSYLNEPSVLHNLEHRFVRDIVYSKAGPVLVAINPYKDVKLYGNEFVTLYRQNLVNSPHVYAIVDSAYNAIIKDELNQSIIISGESGSGKTETAKVVIDYLVTISGDTSGNGITRDVLEASFIILEAFGNAKTSRNDNSSRFGKLIEMYFTEKGLMCGAKIKTFRLEKSRVVKLANGERSYHVFYQLINGASSDTKERLKLKKASDFKYLNQSDCFLIDKVDDTYEFRLLTEAFDTLSICKEDQKNVFEILGALLWLGNISFRVIDNENYVEVVHDEAVINVCNLIHCTALELVHVLTTRNIQVGNNTISEKLTLKQALVTRDALAMFLYSNLFDWLVKELNIVLSMGDRCSGRSICILDMYGFELSKDQFGVNSINERFQQRFYRHLLKFDQEEYELDGIDWTKRSIGLISESDEEPRKAGDLILAARFQQLLDGSPWIKGERGGAFNARFSVGQSQLFESMQCLEKTKSHVICCIKPNNNQHPRVFENDVVLRQLRFLQVLEVIKIAKSGYPTQMSHQEFASRYGFMLPENKRNEDVLSTSIAILQQFDIRPEMYLIGYKKVFLRAGQVDILEDTRKQVRLGKLEVQNRFHGRRDFSQTRESVITLQSFVRGEIGRVRFNILRQKNYEKQLKAVVQIQSAIRGWLARTNFRQLRDSMISNYEEKKHVNTLADLMSMDPQNLPPSADELKIRVLLVGTELRKEEKENVELKEQVQQLETRWLESQANMNSIEETRKKQIESLQMRLTEAARNPGAVEAENGELTPSPCSDHSSGGTRASSVSTLVKLASNDAESRASGLETNGGLTLVSFRANGVENNTKKSVEDNTESITKVIKTERNDEEEYRNLKHKFDAWKKEYKIRLKEMKTKLQRLGRPEGESGRMKWWGRKSKKL